MNLELLRDWIRAEIEYALNDREEDESGYRGCYSNSKERDAAFDNFKKSLEDKT